MKIIKLNVPRLSDRYMLYIYRSTSPNDINTVEKVRKLSPIASIDETIAAGDIYEVFDSSESEQSEGIQYYGPTPDTLPTTEYAMQVGQVMLAKMSYANTLTLSTLEMPYNGIMYYYSIVGVDLAANIITHISKVNGILIDEEYRAGTCDVYECDDSEDSEAEWRYVGNMNWGESITIGDITNQYEWQRWGKPMVDIMPSLDVTQCRLDSKTVPHNNFAVLEIQNPWQKNNERFNYRKLKSYKLRNVLGNIYSVFSEPTYQALLPQPIERMLVLCVSNPSDGDPIPSDYEDENLYKIDIIRRDGIYYNSRTMKLLGINKYNIQVGENLAVFNEGSVQEKIKIQVPCVLGIYIKVTMYLYDCYGTESMPTTFITEVQ